eukprot:2927201-Rhodomonas_salina.2
MPVPKEAYGTTRMMIRMLVLIWAYGATRKAATRGQSMDDLYSWGGAVFGTDIRHAMSGTDVA